MTSITKKFHEKKKKEAIGAMKALIDRMKREELELVDFGFWQGLPGQWNLKISVKESTNQQ